MIWDAADLLIPMGQFRVWSRQDDTLFSLLAIEPDTADLCPEEITTQYGFGRTCPTG